MSFDASFQRAFARYDSWLEEPYERREREHEAAHCPECDQYTFEDEGGGEGRCTNEDCEYSRYRDWDSEPGGADYID